MNTKKVLPIVTVQCWELIFVSNNELRLRGKVYGHPEYIDGKDTISKVVLRYSRAGSYAITTDIFYNLEEPKYPDILEKELEYAEF